MSKLAVHGVKLPFDGDETGIVFELPAGAEIVGNFVHHDPEEKLVLDGNGAKRDGSQLVVVIAYDPDAPNVERTFVRCKAKQVLTLPDDRRLEHVCTFTNPYSGEVTALFEAKTTC